MDDSFDTNERGGDKFDDSGFVVRSVHVFGADWLGEMIVGYLVFLDKAPVEAVD